MFSSGVLSSNIRKYRKKLGVTQSELAEMLGVSVQAVSKWECDAAQPELSKLCEIAQIFHVTLDKLVGIHTDRPLFIGIDGGGSKTEFVLFSSAGEIVNRMVLGGSNPNIVGLQEAISVIRSGIDMLLSGGVEVAGIYAGVAGASLAANGEALRQFLRETYAGAKSDCQSDIGNVIFSATEKETCVAVIMGTGSSVFAKTKEGNYRVGGWGYLLDEGGSGYDIGRDALRAVLASEDGFGKPTALARLIHDKLDGSVWSRIPEIYADDKKRIASFAPAVFDAYRMGDSVAEQILQKNVKRVAELIEYASAAYSCGKTVVLAGGLLHEKDIILPMLRGYMKEGYDYIVPAMPQIFGACMACMRLCGQKTDGFAGVFQKEYERICQREQRGNS